LTRVEACSSFIGATGAAASAGSKTSVGALVRDDRFALEATPGTAIALATSEWHATNAVGAKAHDRLGAGSKRSHET